MITFGVYKGTKLRGGKYEKGFFVAALVAALAAAAAAFGGTASPERSGATAGPNSPIPR